MKPPLSPERWEQIQHLFEEVVDLDPAERASRLDEACRDDAALREEVDSLLAAHAQADDILRDLDHLAPPPAAASLSRVDTRVEHYEVIEKLGDGGMGVVYKARDTRLKRTVALKFLPPQWSQHPDARQRFEHEAQAASALDHPNICTIYEIGEATGGHLFIAMAYYQGQTLKKKINQGSLSTDDALDIAVQIAQGLARAHAKGIIHRDVKPANVILTSEGVVKILDFGLAKVASLTQLTKTGTRMGTVAYMSPEQAQSATVDHRTDFWSLGVVLYEMLTGQRPFIAEFDQALIYAILNIEPTPVTSLRAGLSMHLEHVIDKALAKDPDERYQHADDLLVDLKAVQKKIGSASMTQASRETAPSLLRDDTLAAPSRSYTLGETAPTPAETPAGPVTILVVDDEPEFELLMRHLFRRKVRANQWAFLFAKHGAEALEKVQAHPQIELVLTDLNMPEMDGLTLLTRLGEMDRVLKTVVISAYGDMDNIRTAMNRGAFDFVTKPIDPEDLETTILKTERELRALKKATVAQQQLADLQKEWQVARRLQKAVLPVTFPTRDDVSLYAFTAPAREVSGDFHDFFLIEDDRLGFAIGNVSGKGLSAALFTVMSHTLLRAVALQGALPGACLQHVKDLLALEDLPELSLSVFYGMLDTQTGALAYGNAGQKAPYVLRADGTIERLENPAETAIRLTKDVEYQTQRTTLQPGEGLFLFTNGLLQTQNQHSTLFSRDRLATLLRQRPGATPAEIIRDVVRQVTQFSGEAPQSDDVTFLALRYHGR